jgi:hypothetical protein
MIAVYRKSTRANCYSAGDACSLLAEMEGEKKTQEAKIVA